jgi:serine-type D-Ala-D-Ala carboxypeptidase/endopeptidase (penicillin-binding protein 4)
MRHAVFILAAVIIGAGVPATFQRTLQPPVTVASAAPGALPAVAPGMAPALASLRTTLDGIVDRPGEWSVLAVSLDRGDVLYERNPDLPLAPASNMKVFTAAAAIHYLGADYRFQTYLLTDAPIVDGVLMGDLYLYGTGDPTLGRRFAPRPAHVLEAFADTLVKLGVREIRGSVVGDGSYFQGANTGAGWSNNNLNAWYAAPAGALSVHENLVRLEIKPGERPGHRPRIEFSPGGRGIAVANTAVSGGGGRPFVTRLAFDGPIFVSGRVGGTSSFAVPVGDPTRYAAAMFRDVILSKGIVVTGDIRVIEDAAESPISARTVFAPALEEEATVRILGVHRSGPLHEMLEVVNQQSHNFYSEQIFRKVGRVAVGDGSPAGGALAIEMLLAGAGVDTAGIEIMDGSGLSTLNRVSARGFVNMLAFIAKSEMAEQFEATLPVAGQVRRFRRMGGTPAEGNLRAKTGTINNVSALSGYVTARNGETIAFSIIANNVASVANAKYVENLIGARLAAFDRTAPISDESLVE